MAKEGVGEELRPTEGAVGASTLAEMVYSDGLSLLPPSAPAVGAGASALSQRDLVPSAGKSLSSSWVGVGHYSLSPSPGP